MTARQAITLICLVAALGALLAEIFCGPVALPSGYSLALVVRP